MSLTDGNFVNIQLIVPRRMVFQGTKTIKINITCHLVPAVQQEYEFQGKLIENPAAHDNFWNQEEDEDHGVR
ncbi:hypothetical protein M7I_0437 [Glarea lozoyensis 74030]|uniref:Uncharacterized protein n=1 Tax=Glarea lozoyensis (strain ATCC 74030 / MF5533) TaxID=1104152 RepID=H0EDC9_GLAL7|nr:hypothetical protein M7I_0437 [Glarea lozoyensis 74030]